VWPWSLSNSNLFCVRRAVSARPGPPPSGRFCNQPSRPLNFTYCHRGTKFRNQQTSSVISEIPTQDVRSPVCLQDSLCHCAQLTVGTYRFCWSQGRWSWRSTAARGGSRAGYRLNSSTCSTAPASAPCWQFSVREALALWCR